MDAIRLGYDMLDPFVTTELLKADGDTVRKGDLIAKIGGPVRVLLAGERVILNVLQHMSGIATKTASAVNELEGSSTRICDTRKTLPGLRALQKYAVRCGGGYNHRMRLDDGIMIKDNHIAAAGSITQAVKIARKHAGLMVKIEVECETEEQVKEAVEAGADIIMLDNQTPESAADLCAIIPDNIIIELSGGMAPETVGNYKNCGAHYISMGSITHSVSALDISFVLSGTVKNVTG
jgi:nicotinate-nucleotide pyrophosphorylase (carboxylating)